MESFPEKTLFLLLSNVSALDARLAAIESALDTLTRAAGKRRTDPQWLSIADAARLCGRTKRGTQNLIRREREKSSGFALRVMHGHVHRADFNQFLESKQKPARGEIIRAAINSI